MNIFILSISYRSIGIFDTKAYQSKYLLTRRNWSIIRETFLNQFVHIIHVPPEKNENIANIIYVVPSKKRKTLQMQN